MRIKAHWRKGSRTDYHMLFAQKCHSHGAIVNREYVGLLSWEDVLSHVADVQFTRVC